MREVQSVKFLLLKMLKNTFKNSLIILMNYPILSKKLVTCIRLYTS